MKFALRNIGRGILDKARQVPAWVAGRRGQRTTTESYERQCERGDDLSVLLRSPGWKHLDEYIQAAIQSSQTVLENPDLMTQEKAMERAMNAGCVKALRGLKLWMDEKIKVGVRANESLAKPSVRKQT